MKMRMPTTHRLAKIHKSFITPEQRWRPLLAQMGVNLVSCSNREKKTSAESSFESAVGVWRRRGFLSAAATLAATLSPLSRALNSDLSPSTQPLYPGRSVLRGDDDYERWRLAMAWQLYTAPRYPDVIVRPDHRDQVSDIVKQCARERRKIAVKSGGHNVSEAFLRDGGLLLDLGELQTLSVSDDGKNAWVDPAIWSYELLRGIDPFGAAFPVAHCATVPMGGFLMGGGIGYNHDNWGAIGCENIVAAEVVIPNGQALTVSAEEQPDLFWALKGAGMGFPGVVTRLKLKLHAKPQSVMETAAIFPIGKLNLAIELLGDWANANPPDTELMMLLANNPMATSETPPEARKMAIARAVTYTQSEANSRSLLERLAAHPNTAHAVAPIEFKPTTLQSMSIESVNPSMGLGFGRYAVDTIWTDQLRDMSDTLQECILQAPSSKTHFVISPKINQKIGDTSAFSRIGQTFVGAYTVWDEEAYDASNFGWLDDTRQALQPFSKGQYINEVDAFNDPSAPRRCFSDSAWVRLNQLRELYDSEGLFHGWPSKSMS